MALSSFSLWDKALQGGLGMGFSFFSLPMLLVRLETSPQLLGSTCTSLREGGCLCIDMGWLEQPIPQKHQLGRGTPVDPWLQGREGERPWDMEHLGTSLGGHRAARSPWNVLDGSMSGWHPSICIWVFIPVQTWRGSQENTILETSFDSHDSQQVLLPSPPAAAFRELLPASGMVYCWITQSPTSDSRHYRSVFIRFIERISLKKGNLVAWGLVGWL